MQIGLSELFVRLRLVDSVVVSVVVGKLVQGFSFTNTEIHLNANIPREVAKNSPKEFADHKSRSDLKIPLSLE